MKTVLWLAAALMLQGSFALADTESDETEISESETGYVCKASYVYDFSPFHYYGTGVTRSMARHAALKTCNAHRINSFMSTECRIDGCALRR